MRGLLAGGLVLTAGLWVGSVRGGQPPARVHTAKTEIASIGLGRPVPLDAPTPANAFPGSINDQQLQPATFCPLGLGRAEPLVRGQIPDNLQPLPAGPLIDTAAPPQSKQEGSKSDKNDILPTPRLMPAPPPNEPPVSASKVPLPAPNNCECVDCCSDCCDTCGDCCGGWRRPFWWLWEPGDCVNPSPYCVWFSAEYLLWAIKDSRIPALVSTSPLGTPRSQAGVLNTPGEMTLFGGSSMDNDARSGARFTLGFWFDQERDIGLEASVFFLGDRSLFFNAGSFGAPILARPFVDAATMMEASELVAFPGVVSGSVSVRSQSEFHGAEVNLRTNVGQGCCWRLDLLSGVRYLGLHEGISIVESLTAGPASGALAGSSIGVWDSFGTHNTFWGGQLGLDLELRQGPWSLNLLGKIALGGTHETVNINGSTSLAFPMTMPSVQMGGLLAQPTNIGHYSRNRFAVAPEAGVKLGYQVTDWMKLTVGYSFVYLSDVARPGHQIDRTINTSQLASQLGGGMLAGPARPAFVFKGTDFWGQGLNLGMELRY